MSKPCGDPDQAVAAYAEVLVGRGVLTRVRGDRWQSDLHRGHQARQRVLGAAMARGRTRRLKDAVTGLLADMPRGREFDLAAWLVRPLSPGGPTPSVMAAEGGARYGELLRRITKLGATARDPHSTPMADLMGLPLETARGHVFGLVESGGGRP